MGFEPCKYMDNMEINHKWWLMIFFGQYYPVYWCILALVIITIQEIPSEPTNIKGPQKVLSTGSSHAGCEVNVALPSTVGWNLWLKISICWFNPNYSWSNFGQIMLNHNFSMVIPWLIRLSSQVSVCQRPHFVSGRWASARETACIAWSGGAQCWSHSPSRGKSQ